MPDGISTASSTTSCGTPKEELRADVEDGAAPTFEGMIRDAIVMRGRESLMGADTYVLSGPAGALPKGMGIGPLGRIEVRIGIADGLFHQRVITNAEGGNVIRETRTGMRVDVHLPDSLFTFTPPEEAQVIDMTSGIANQIRKMHAPRKQ